MKALFLSTCLAAWAVGSLPLTVGAQTSALGQPEQVEDVLTFEAGLTLNTNSNIFLLDSRITDAQIQATYGDTSRSDTTLEGRFGIKFDRDFSLQRVTLKGTLLPLKHFKYSDFDTLGYDASANWDWAVGRPFFGTLGVKFGQELSSFADVSQLTNQRQKNVVKSTSFYLTAGMRVTPNWSLLSGFDVRRQTNSATSENDSDYRFGGLEFGVRFAPGTGTQFDFLIRQLDGDYPNRQIFDSLGRPLLLVNQNGVDNAFKETAALVRLQYKPSNDTTMSGQFGLTKRSFDNFSSRDFSGPTARLALDWRPGGAFFMGVDLVRALNSEEILTASYVDTTQLNLRPSIRLTGKTSLNGTLSIGRRDYGGDPGFVNTNVDVRSDDVTILGLRADWAYSRNVLISLGFTRESRSSNFANFDYTNNVLSLGGRIAL